ncbi:DUF4224 domain-containing protein [Pseudomonas phoenicis]|uniref:DUF4224 domain-containing protein n=1 Tax=unclassified Pseudomonas TaxID=196821 RepID=UPI0039A05272
METEILTDTELVEITGYKPRAYQRRWLSSHGWHFVESRGGRPLVGRQYARFMLSGLVVESTPTLPPTPLKSAWVPDFSQLK